MLIVQVFKDIDEAGDQSLITVSLIFDAITMGK